MPVWLVVQGGLISTIINRNEKCVLNEWLGVS